MYDIVICMWSRAKMKPLINSFFIRMEWKTNLIRKLKKVRSDRGNEYETPIGEFYASVGIVHESTPLYSPQSNAFFARN